MVELYFNLERLKMTQTRQPISPKQKFLSELLQDQEYTKGWHNFTKNRELPDAIVIDIENKESLQTFVKKIYEFNNNDKTSLEDVVSFRAVGGNINNSDQHDKSRSISACAEADILLQLTGKEFKTVSVNKESNTANLGASASIGEVNKTLYEDHKLMLTTAPLADFISIAGLTAIGANGTGIKDGSFCEPMVEMTFCLPNGEIKTIRKGDAEFEVIRGAHFGLFGILLNVKMQCEPAQKLKLTTVPCYSRDALKKTLEEVMERLKTAKKGAGFSIKQLALTVYAVEIQEPVSLETPNCNHHPRREALWQKVSMALVTHISGVFAAMSAKYPSLASRLIQTFLNVIAPAVEFPRNTSESIGPYYEILHRRKGYPKIDFAAALVPRKKDSVEAIMEGVDYASDLLAKYPLSVMYGVYYRYFAGTNGGLSSSYHEPDEAILAIDFASDPRMKDWSNFLKKANEGLIEKFQARLHPAKNLPEDIDFKKMYGKHWVETKNIFEKWVKECGVTELARYPFLNRFCRKIFEYNLKKPLFAYEESKPRIAAEEKCHLVSSVTNEKQRTIVNVANCRDGLFYSDATQPSLSSVSASVSVSSSNDEDEAILDFRLGT